MSASRVLVPGALLSALLSGEPALAQTVDPFDSAGGGIFVGYAFGSGGDTVTWGLEAFLSKEVDQDICANEPRTVYGPIARLSLHGFSRPAITLAAHGGREIERGGLGFSGEAGLTLGYPLGLEGDPLLTPHTGVAAESIIFDAFARQEWLLHVYSVGAGVRVPPTFGGFSSCVVGRPQRDAEGRRLQTKRNLVPCEALSASEALAHDWRAQAREELESVPAFLRLASELSHAGAPAALVHRALLAARDELGHARLCSTVASVYGHRYTPPAPQQLERKPLPGREGLERLAIESFLDGCVGEGLAARLAEDDARHTSEALVSHAQSSIARDEARHERLAWDIVSWCLERDPRVKRLLRAVSPTSVEPPPTLTGNRERQRGIAERHHTRSVEHLNALF